MIRKVSAEDIAIRGNGTGLEYMCPTRHFVYIFFNPVFQVSTAKNEINLFNNHVLIVAPVTFAPAGAMTPSAEFLFIYLFIYLSFRCGHGIPWWRWNQDNQLYVKVPEICARKGWWRWKKRKELNLILNVYILYAVYKERKYWIEFWSLLFSIINSVQHQDQYPCKLVQHSFLFLWEKYICS